MQLPRLIRLDFLLLFALAWQALAATPPPAPKAGDRFPLSPELRAGLERDAAGRDYLAGRTPALLLAFVPSVTPRCEYARMMGQAFDLYFRQGLAFADGGPEIAARPAILLVSGDSAAEGKDYLTRNSFGFPLVQDGGLAQFLTAGLSLPLDKNGNATVMVLDGQGVVRRLWTDYRGLGEQLKVVEVTLKVLLNPARAEKPADDTGDKPRVLQVGDRAPDFAWSGAVSERWGEGRLSALRGKTVVVSFYPAPYSGLTTADVDARLRLVTQDAEVKDAAKKARSEPEIDRYEIKLDIAPTITEFEGFVEYGGSCVGQTASFDTLAKLFETLGSTHAIKRASSTGTSITLSKSHNGAAPKDDAVLVLLITTSTPALVRHWTATLGVKHNVMVNDPGFRIADLYESHHPAGYNERTVFVVDGAGVIRHVNRAYDVGKDFERLKEEILKAGQ